MEFAGNDMAGARKSDPAGDGQLLEETTSFGTGNGRDTTKIKAHDVSEEVRERYQDMVMFIEKDLDKSSRLNVSAKAALKVKVAEWAFAQAELVGYIKKLEEENKALKAESQSKTPGISYAQVAGSRPSLGSQVQKLVSKAKPATIFITGKNNENAKEVQATLMKVVNPTKDKIKIKSIRTAGKTVVVETAGETDIQKLRAHKPLNDTLRIEAMKKRKPLVILYDVPADQSDETLKMSIYEQNLEGQINKDEYQRDFNVRFKAGPRGKPTVHLVVETSNTIRKMLLRQGRIYIGFRAVAAKDYIVVARCNRCRDLGHVAKHCNKEECCDHCGNAGHKKDKCPKKIQSPTCIPCARRGKKCNATTKTDCPTHKLMLERLIQRTDYD